MMPINGMITVAMISTMNVPDVNGCSDVSVAGTEVGPADGPPATGASPEVFARYAAHDWIVNSRNTADELVVRAIAAMADFEPRVAHRADSLELVQDMIVAGLGVGLLPADQPTLPGVRLLPLTGPEARLRSYAVVRRGRAGWPPLALVLDLIRARARAG